MIEGQFVPLTRALMMSAGFQALTVPARHILDFLMIEHMTNGGAENGRLMAPYLQLETWGISNRDIRPALDMLEAFGLIGTTARGERQGGRPNASRYALTWLPTFDGGQPTDDFKKVTAAEVKSYKEARACLKAQRATRKFEEKASSDPKNDLTGRVADAAAKNGRGQALRDRAACNANAAALSNGDIDSSPQMTGGPPIQMRGDKANLTRPRPSKEGRIAIQMRGDAWIPLAGAALPPRFLPVCPPDGPA